MSESMLSILLIFVEDVLLFLDDNLDELSEWFSYSSNTASRCCLTFLWLFDNFSLALLVKVLLIIKVCNHFIVCYILLYETSLGFSTYQFNNQPNSLYGDKYYAFEFILKWKSLITKQLWNNFTIILLHESHVNVDAL